MSQNKKLLIVFIILILTGAGSESHPILGFTSLVGWIGLLVVIYDVIKSRIKAD